MSNFHATMILEGLAVFGLLGGAALSLVLLPWTDAEVASTARALSSAAERARPDRPQLAAG